MHTGGSKASSNAAILDVSTNLGMLHDNGAQQHEILQYK